MSGNNSVSAPQTCILTMIEATNRKFVNVSSRLRCSGVIVPRQFRLDHHVLMRLAQRTEKLFHSPQHVPIFSVSDLFNDNYDKVTINFMTTYYCSFESRSPYKSSYCWSSCPGVLDRLVLLEERMGKKGTKVRWFSVDGLQWSGVKEKENQVKLKLENIKEKLASFFLSVC